MILFFSVLYVVSTLGLFLCVILEARKYGTGSFWTPRDILRTGMVILMPALNTGMFLAYLWLGFVAVLKSPFWDRPVFIKKAKE